MRAGAPAGRLDMKVALVQPLGDRLNVYLGTPRHDNLIAQVSADAQLRAGQSVPFYLDMSRAHFFAPGEAGPALALNRERWAASSSGPAVA
jgi:hypothetical protein